MFRKIETLKSFQLFVYFAISIAGIAVFILDGDYALAIGENEVAFKLATAGFALVILGFVFIFLDYSVYIRENKRISDMYTGYRSDRVARINNRNSVDDYIEAWREKKIPRNMCCVLLALHSLEITNVKHDRTEGDNQVRAFSNILGLAATSKAFVGRNGGGEFLVFFENAKEETLRDFFFRIEALVLSHNEIYDKSWIRYRFGVAYNGKRELTNIGDLIHVAYERVKEAEIIPDSEGNFKEYHFEE